MSIVTRIAIYEQHDADAVADAMTVMQSAFDPAFGEAWNADQLGSMLDMPGSWMAVARAGDRPAGFALLRGVLDEVELLLIAVHKSFQSQSIGRTLLDNSIASARARNIRSMNLEVRAGNRAMELYKSAGFFQIARRREYYRGKDGELHDALTFQREL